MLEVFICESLVNSAKHGDKTVMGHSRPNFSPKLVPLHRTTLDPAFQGALSLTLWSHPYSSFN